MLEDILHTQYLMAYNNGNTPSRVINTYQFSRDGNIWYDIKRGDEIKIFVNSDIPVGQASEYETKLYIRLKYCSLDYVYKYHHNFYNVVESSAYQDKQHTWTCGLRFHIPSDMTSSVGSASSFLIKSQYYGGENETFALFDFETEPLRVEMLNNSLYRVFIYMNITGVSNQDIFNFNLLKNDAAIV